MEQFTASAVEYFSGIGLSPAAVVMIIAMLPILELRAAIPVGIVVLGMGARETLFWALIGNFLVVMPVILFLNHFVEFLTKRSKWCDRFFTRLFEHTQKQHSKKFTVFGDVALVLFVSIPFPGTGAWSGAIAAYVFGIPTRTAALLICLGVTIAGTLVTLITTGAFAVFT